MCTQISILKPNIRLYRIDESVYKLSNTTHITQHLSLSNKTIGNSQNIFFSHGNHYRLNIRMQNLFFQSKNIISPTIVYCRVNYDTSKQLLPLFYQPRYSHAYAFIATLGNEFNSWIDSLDSCLDSYLSHLLGMWILHKSVNDLKTLLNLDNSWNTIYPGTTPSLPLQYNYELYHHFKDHLTQIGVSINDAYMFSPLYTVAGYILPHFLHSSCSLCTYAQCQFRNILT